jgi:predicted SAM-dependent methyltransferase
MRAVSRAADIARAHATRARRRVRDVVLSRDPDVRTVREDLALRFLRGDGIEIGALDFPLRVPPGARVRYVDRKDEAGLRTDFPELDGHEFVPVHIVDDATTLATIPDASLDFVVASHVIEHLEDPIGALRAWLRVTKPDGVVWLAVPDRRRTFDAGRPATTLEHVIRDHAEGPAWSRTGHYEEWARLVDGIEERYVPAYAQEWIEKGMSIHFHVWELEDLAQLLLHAARDVADLEHLQTNGHENLAVLRKR